MDATNGDVLTSHLATLEALIQEHGITTSHIANLDETGVSPNRDAKGKMRMKWVARWKIRTKGKMCTKWVLRAGTKIHKQSRMP